MPISQPPLRLRHRLQRLTDLDLAGELLHLLSTIGVYASSIPHQHDAPEQIPLEQKRVPVSSA